MPQRLWGIKFARIGHQNLMKIENTNENLQKCLFLENLRLMPYELFHENNRKYGRKYSKSLLVEIGKPAPPWRRITLWATYGFMPYELNRETSCALALN